MKNESSNPSGDLKLMKRAKTIVCLGIVYKWLWVFYVLVNAFLLIVWYLTGRRFFWPGLVMGTWGFGLVVVGIVFKFIISSSSGIDDKINAEYNKLKNSKKYD